MNLSKYILTTYLVFLFNILNISAQQQYNIASLYETSSIFSESFDDNKNVWIIDNPWVIGRFEKGHYILKCKNLKGESGLSYKAFNIDLNKDFEIESTIQIVKGTGGLLLGMTDQLEHYRIEITDKNDLVVIKNIPLKGSITRLLNYRDKSFIQSSSPVKITIRKVENIFYLFINELLIKEFNNIIPQGKQIGFNVGLNSEISVDYLNISYIEKRTTPLVEGNNLAKDNVAANPPINNITAQIMAGKKVLTSADAPVIAWISPSNDSTTINSFTARIRAGIRSTTDLKSVLIYVNGASKGEGERRSSTGEEGNFIAEGTISLNPGINDVYLVATNNAGTTRSESRYFKNPAATFPVISWINPASVESVVNTDRITVDVCINSPSGINSARILVNGEERGMDNVFQSAGSGECTIRWQKPVILKEGENSIYILATNVAGSTSSENRIIRFLPALQERRIALVIGNSDYINNVSLKNPVNDANLIEATLKSLGFDVIKQLNSGKDTMEKYIREFSRKLSDNNVALFYYAGHGLQVDGINYLIPTDAKLNNKEDCRWEAVDIGLVTEEFKRHSTNTNIVILDACRNNPYRSWARGGEAGFKALGQINGTIISFATSEGATAADGIGNNGLFTEELVKQMVIPQPIESVFKKTRKQVMDRSNGQQTPTEWSYLTGEFYFKK